MGIGGVGMAGVAFLLKKNGHAVSGCDLHRSPRTNWLEAHGIPVAEGHSPSHVNGGVDELVVTPAVRPDDPELAAAASFRYRGQVLAELFNAADGVAVCGTHGKTTTSTFTAKLLHALGADPSWCIGGETREFPVAGAGHGPFVIEADESDGTLALYRAKTLVVTSLDYDHPDHFKTYDDYLACYRKAMDAAGDVIMSEELPSDDWPEIRTLVSGEHNVRNARAAVEVALRRGYAREAILQALPHALSALPDRRFELLAQNGGIRLYTDYAHHPVELKCALSMARATGAERIRAMFQPHRYSRTKTLLEDFPEAFADADETVLIPVYAAFEPPLTGGDIADLYAAFRRHPQTSAKVKLARDAREAWKHLFLTSRPGDVLMILGAGDLVSVIPQAKDDIASATVAAERKFTPLAPFSFFRTGGSTCGKVSVSAGEASADAMIMGMGSNTWISDLATDRDIVKPDLPAGATLLDSHPELAFMAGIPGTVGGWAKMNAGAHGDSFGNHIDYVIADGRKIPADECAFAYRTSSIPGIITEVVLKNDGIAGSGAEAAAAYAAKRKKFPPRTCGSVFKNPSPDVPAGKLLEEAGVKGLKIGGASVWEEHANVIVAGEGCNSSDILALARMMAAKVRESSGIELEPEIRGLPRLAR